MSEPAHARLSDQPLVVHLARAGRSVSVDAHTSILDALLFDGIAIASSCQQGICGTCETKVLAGQPDHRDQVLSAAERASNTTMMLCCSRALTPELTLDL